MAVSGISPLILSNAFGINPIGTPLSPEDRKVLADLILLTHVHEVIMDSWAKFREGMSDIEDQKRSSDRTQDLRSRNARAQQAEGARRQEEARNAESEGIVPLHAGRLHIGLRRYHQVPVHKGGFLDQTGKVNIPV